MNASLINILQRLRKTFWSVGAKLRVMVGPAANSGLVVGGGGGRWEEQLCNSCCSPKLFSSSFVHFFMLQLELSGVNSFCLKLLIGFADRAYHVKMH